MSPESHSILRHTPSYSRILVITKYQKTYIYIDQTTTTISIYTIISYFKLFSKMANDNHALPANFSGDGARSVPSDATVETIAYRIAVEDSEVSSPLFKNLESGHSVGQHGRMLTATDPTHVASTSGVGNVSAPPSR